LVFLLLCLLTAIGLSPGGSTQLHTNNTIEQHKQRKKRMWKSAGRAPSKNASFTLAFALKLRKKHGKASVRDEEPQSGSEKAQSLQNSHTG
jgi:hypothetical protein